MDFLFSFLFFSSPAGLPTPSALACRPAQIAQPTWPLSRSACVCLWRILQKTFSSLIHVFRSWCLLSLPSLTHGPCLLALSSTPRRLTPIAPPLSPAASGLSAPLLRTSRCRPEPLLAPPSLPLSSSRALTRRDEPIYSAIQATTPHRPLPHLHYPGTLPGPLKKGNLCPRASRTTHRPSLLLSHIGTHPHRALITASHPYPPRRRFPTSRAPMSPQMCSPLPPPPPPPRSR
jgi:hypothetical protein